MRHTPIQKWWFLEVQVLTTQTTSSTSRLAVCPAVSHLWVFTILQIEKVTNGPEIFMQTHKLPSKFLIARSAYAVWSIQVSLLKDRPDRQYRGNYVSSNRFWGGAFWGSSEILWMRSDVLATVSHWALQQIVIKLNDKVHSALNVVLVFRARMW